MDIGDKRIGVAVSDELEITSLPLEVYKNDDKVNQKIGSLIGKYNIKIIVVGLPYTLKGEIGTQAKKVIDFTNDLMRELDIRVDYIDERYTTKIPLRLTGKGAKDKKIDKFSAAIILSDYLKRRKRQIEDIK